jgi:hypothetical protein
VIIPPFLPSSIRLERVLCACRRCGALGAAGGASASATVRATGAAAASASAVVATGGRCGACGAVADVAWRIQVGKPVARNKGLIGFVGIGDGPCDPYDPQSVAACMVPIEWEAFDRFHIRLLGVEETTVNGHPAKNVPLGSFEVRDGVDCDGEPVFAGTITPVKTGTVDLVQVSGLLMTHMEVHFAPDAQLAADPLVMLDIILDRKGPPFQVRWGASVTPTFPAGAAGQPFNVFP